MSTSTSSVVTLKTSSSLLTINGKILKLPSSAVTTSGTKVYAPEKK